ncbi:putative florfenicol exporter [Whalleya microplaca]|nr:putative florfenicol exporter [Whalleya microplaca]
MSTEIVKQEDAVVGTVADPTMKSVTGNPEDLEPGSDLQESEVVRHLEQLKKQFGATWEGPDDPEDPYNWSPSRKISIGLIVSVGQLVTLMSASMMAAALHDISSDLQINASTAQITFSTYFLGLAFGPCVIAAISEMNGRKNIWMFSNVWYILWNSLCPVGKSKALMVIGRFLAATGASAGITLTGPVMADMYLAKDRGKSLAIAAFLPYLGPALGPIVGGLITQFVYWPWLFWIVSIFNALITLIGTILIKESYTPVLLRRKAARQSQQPIDPAMSPSKWLFWHDVLRRLAVNLQRPILLLIQRPIVQVISLFLALNFGIYTLVLSTYATLWIDQYGQDAFQSSLHYLSISVGCTVSAQVGGRIMDWIYGHLRDRPKNKGEGMPEFRVPYMGFGVLLVPVGLLWYGWSAQDLHPWIAVDIGAAVFTSGSFLLGQALLAYTLDEFGVHGASANASTRLLSNVLGFAFPIFAPQLYQKLGYGWGNSLLALIFVVFGFPVPLCLWIWGAKLRAVGKK